MYNGKPYTALRGGLKTGSLSSGQGVFVPLRRLSGGPDYVPASRYPNGK
jgi:hypothetical protein